MQNEEDVFSTNSSGYCECCLSKIKLKVMTQPIFNSSKKEIYYDMLIECFSTEIFSKKTVENCSMYICEECIAKLRDSYDFCIQIKTTQKKLIEHEDDDLKVFTFDGIKLEYSVENKNGNLPLDEYSCLSSGNEFASDSAVFTCPIKTKRKKTKTKENVPKKKNCLSFNKPTARKSKNDTASKSKTDTPSKRKGDTTLKSKSPNSKKKVLKSKRDITIESKDSTSLKTKNDSLDDQNEEFKNSLNIDKTEITKNEVLSLPIEYEMEYSNSPLPSPESPNDGFFENVQKFLDKTSKKRNMKGIKSSNNGTDKTVKKQKRSEEAMIRIRARDKQRRLDMRPFKIDKTELICHVCHKEFLTNRWLMTHMNEHFPMYVCDQCGKGFTLRATLRGHIKCHEEKVACSVCNKFFIKSSIRMHMMRHLGKKDFHPCPMCEMRFESPFKRSAHIEKIHKIVKRYTCETCGKIFDMSYKYRLHLRRHNPHFQPSINDAYECEICQKTFPSKCHLNNHKIVHVTERKFQCHLCPKNYKVKALLNRHLREHDDNSDKFLCSVCNRSFVVKHLLKQHLMRVHKIKIDLNSIVPTIVGKDNQ